MACKYVPVPKEDTYALIKEAQTGNEDAKALLVEQNTGLVKKIALKFSSSEYELEDLVQIGYMGLLKAVDKFDPNYDVMFSTYAVPMIMGEIKRFFRDNGKIKVSRTLKTEIYTLKQVEAELAAKHGSPPRLHQLAEAMGMTKEHILEILEAEAQFYHIASLDNQLVEQEYENMRTVGSPESKLDIMMMKQELAQLRPKERQVIIFRYYRDMTQQEIGDLLKISQVQVSRIEKKALSKMRAKMSEVEQ